MGTGYKKAKCGNYHEQWADLLSCCDQCEQQYKEHMKELECQRNQYTKKA